MSPACHGVRHLEQVFIGDVQSAESDRALFLEQAAAQRVSHALRLLHDFLEHEMGVAATLDGREVPFHLRDCLLLLRSREIHDPVIAGRDLGDFAVIEVDDGARVREHRRCIGRNPILSIADGDEQRRPAARRDERIGLARRDHGDAVRTFDLPQRRGGRVHQGRARGVRLFNQMGENFGVGLRAKDVTALCERLA